MAFCSVFQFHGSNSVKRDTAMSGMRARTSSIHACGSISFILQLTIRVYTIASCRHSKDHLGAAREAMLAFFESLPGRKLLLNGDDLLAFHPE